MNEQNFLTIGQALNHTLRPMLASFVQKKLARYFGANDWWQRGVLEVLYDDQKRYLPRTGTYEELTDALDVQKCLLLIEIHWREIFSAGLSRTYFNYVKELQAIRNLWAHEPESFDDAATIRALDTMARISEAFDEEITKELRSMWQSRLQAEKPAAVVEVPKIFSQPQGTLKPWRDVMEPHPDVAQGRYRQAEFAADLGQVVRGEGNIEYTDPIEFFSRTYLTGGLKNLLVEILRRLAHGNGNPVIQLKTSFGGGKTHSLLALYHLFGGKIHAEQSAVVTEVLNAAEVSSLPKVHTAVIVGTWQNPVKATLWGEIAAQLARSTGKPELYEIMRKNDEQGTAPGVEDLKKLFDAAGSCLILIDELVAYARKLRLGEINSGGTFGNLMSFIQELTEAAKASSRCAVVVSIPESDAEVVDDLGRRVLEQIEKFFGRVEFVWTPIGVEEGYEIVRRRLFKPCRDESAREKVCAAFFSMYVANPNDFPYESRQSSYRDKLLACYPIHPKLFDFLYDKWTSLEKFQKTRGVLRLMANVIYNLWTQNDASLLIMPGNLPLNAESVHNELTKFLGGNWDAIVNAEVDGDRSKPRELDSQHFQLGRLTAARKIARTIFMGTAPGSRKGDVRGVQENEIRLGVIQPHDFKDNAFYNNALSWLKDNLYYLYSRDGRFWFSVNPTLRKFVKDKREQFLDNDIEYAIEQRLKSWRGRGKFKAVYICPKSSADVPDEQTARLVILPPKNFDAAIETAKDFLANRGTVPRRWKNMLLFMATDSEKLRILQDAVRDFLAWEAINNEARHLNLDSLQIEDAKNNLKTATDKFAMKLSQAYSKIFAPERAEDGDLNRPMDVDEIKCTKEDNIAAASDKFTAKEKIVENLGTDKLRQLLDKFIWHDADSVQLNQLWEYFAIYYYMPRLAEVNVLIDCVRRGVAAETFGLAENFSDGRYTDLHFGDVACGQFSLENLLVKAEVAKKQLEPLKTESAAEVVAETETAPEVPETVIDKPDLPPPLPTHFAMDVELDSVRYNKDIKNYIGEVASYLMNLPSAKTSIRVAINITVPDGVPADIQEIVEANCLELKIAAENFYFE